MKQIYLKTGEFAAICGVTKHTLFHYDEIGLLHPAKINEKGYRLYAIHQLHTFDMIRILKGMGMPLEEIQEYIQNRDVHAFLDVLKDKKKEIQQEIKRLNRLEQSLQNTVDVTIESFHVPIGQIQIVQRNPAYYIVTEGYTGTDARKIAAAFSHHVTYCRAKHGYHTVNVGEIVRLDPMHPTVYRSHYYSTEIKGPRKAGPHIRIKEAGTYAVQYVRCSYEDLNDAYFHFIHALQQQGYIAQGPIYQDDVRNYLVETDDTKYLMKLEVAVTTEV